MPDQTLSQVAVEARHAISGLEKLIERQRKLSLRRTLLVTLIAIPLGMVVAMGVTISTISVCFLGDSTDRPPAVCNVIPGYPEAVLADEKAQARFERLEEVTMKNGKRLDRLEKRK